MPCLRSKRTLGARPQMCNVSIKFIFKAPDVHSLQTTQLHLPNRSEKVTTTQLHLPNRSEKVTTCFVLFTKTTGRDVSVPTEAIEQMLSRMDTEGHDSLEKPTQSRGETSTGCATVSPMCERPVHSDDNRTLSLRAVDSTSGDDAWAITDDRCNSYCHDEAERRNAEIWLHRETTTPNGEGTIVTNTTRGTLEGVTLCDVSSSWFRELLSDDLLLLAHSVQMCCSRILPFPTEGLGGQWMFRTPHPLGPR